MIKNWKPTTGPREVDRCHTYSISILKYYLGIKILQSKAESENVIKL